MLRWCEVGGWLDGIVVWMFDNDLFGKFIVSC